MWRVLPTHCVTQGTHPTGALLLYYALLSTYRAIVRIDFIGADSGQARSLFTADNWAARTALWQRAQRGVRRKRERKYQLKCARRNCTALTSYGKRKKFNDAFKGAVVYIWLFLIPNINDKTVIIRGSNSRLAILSNYGKCDTCIIFYLGM